MNSIEYQIQSLRAQEKALALQRFELEQAQRNKEDIAKLNETIDGDRANAELLMSETRKILEALSAISPDEYNMMEPVDKVPYSVVRPKGLTEKDIVYNTIVEIKRPYISHGASGCTVEGYLYKDVNGKTVRFRLTVPFNTRYSMRDTVDVKSIDDRIHIAYTLKLSQDVRISSIARLKDILEEMYPEGKVSPSMETLNGILYRQVSLPNGLKALYTYTAGASDRPGEVLPELMDIDATLVDIAFKKRIMALYTPKTQ